MHITPASSLPPIVITDPMPPPADALALAWIMRRARVSQPVAVAIRELAGFGQGVRR